MKRNVCFSALVAICSTLVHAENGNAAFLPSGPQNDVLLSTVTGAWGWTLVYRDDYSVDSVTIATAFGGVGNFVMLGGIQDGSLTIDVLAATSAVDAFTHTNQNVTTTSNGSEWYYNGGSLGFAGLGDTILQLDADINGPSERDRLSWHTNGPGGFFGEYSASPTDVRFGFRSGDNIGLNNSSDWDKLVFTADTVVVIPLPAAAWMALPLLGSLGVAGAIRRKRQAA